jgi:GNAT superfamily N-acetyltransferase
LPKSFSIRSASADDASGILHCLQTAFEPYRKDYTPQAFEDTVLNSETVRKRMVAMSIFVAVSPTGEVVGTIACKVVEPGHGHLRGMAVLPQWHGQGVAKELLAVAEEELRRQGCTRVTLNTTEPLHRAVHFYEKNGYRASGKIREFFGMPLYDREKQL